MITFRSNATTFSGGCAQVTRLTGDGIRWEVGFEGQRQVEGGGAAVCNNTFITLLKEKGKESERSSIALDFWVILIKCVTGNRMLIFVPAKENKCKEIRWRKLIWQIFNNSP